MSTPIGERAPYSASSVNPATIVGRANGRSISMLTKDLPGNSSRTSTHAISVPITTLTTVTASAIPSVSLSAATACGCVTWSQNSPAPPSNDFAVTAASGSRTMTLRYRTATPPASGTRAAPALGRRSVLTGSDAKALLDLSDDPLGIEELVVHRGPAAELVDLEQPARRRVLGLVDQ